MRLFSTLDLTRSFLGGCAFLLLSAPAARAQEASWRGYSNLGLSSVVPTFAYRRNVSVNLQLPRRVLPTMTIAATRQLTEHFAVGVEERLTGINYSLRYRYRNSGGNTSGLADGLLLQLGVNGQLLVPLGPGWELGAAVNASCALTSLSMRVYDRQIWQPSNSGDGQELRLHVEQLRQTSLLAGTELRLLHWLGDSPHGLLLTVGYQQGLYNLVQADSQEFSYYDSNNQLYRGEFGLRLKGSYTSVQLGYCFAWGQAAAAPQRRWSTPRYSQPARPVDEDPEEVPDME